MDERKKPEGDAGAVLDVHRGLVPRVHAVTHGRLVALAFAGLLAACGPTFEATDFDAPDHPRHTGANVRGPELRVVSFNIKYAQGVEGAIHHLAHRPELRQPDVLLLQEMDHEGVKTIARALGLNYVYYPSTRHPEKKAKDRKNGKLPDDHPEFGYFGAAILSPWPLENDQKILLGRDSGRKAAVAATVVWPHGRLRVVNVHLPSGLGERFSGELAGLLACVFKGDCGGGTVVPPSAWASPTGGNFVLGGDFNSYRQAHLDAIAEQLREHGASTVPGIRSTANTLFLRVFPRWLSFDHIIHGGDLEPVPRQAGALSVSLGVSDHRPIWAVLRPRAGSPTPAP